MKNETLTEILFKKKKKRQEDLERKLDCKFISKKIMMQIMRLLEYKHLLVSSKIKIKRFRKRKIKK